MALKEDPRVSEFKAQVEERLAAIQRHTMQGKCQSYDEYKRQVGVFQGLLSGVRILDDVIKNYGKEDGDE